MTDYEALKQRLISYKENRLLHGPLSNAKLASYFAMTELFSENWKKHDSLNDYMIFLCRNYDILDIEELVEEELRNVSIDSLYNMYYYMLNETSFGMAMVDPVAHLIHNIDQIV